MKKIIFFFTCALFVNCMTAFAQKQCKIIGAVHFNNGDPVEYASAIVYNGNTIVKGAVTNDKGSFNVAVDNCNNRYTLSIEYIGFSKKTFEFVPNKTLIDLGNVIIEEDAQILKDVTVTARANAQKNSLEKTTINAASNMASSKGSALDILSTSSSVTVSNETISIRGNTNILVLIDGIPTTVNDLSAIPAANIKSIDIITNPDASYDSGGTGGIINIVSKKGSTKGFSGVIGVNYGFNHFVTGNIAFTYNKDKVSYRLSYNTKYEDDAVNTILSRTIHNTANQTFQQLNATRYVNNNNISLGADFRLNKRNIINVDIKCIIPRLNISQNLKNRFISSGVETNENRHNNVTWNRENIEASILYKHVIKPEISDISFKGSVSKIWGHRPSFYYLQDELVNKSNSGGSPFITSFQGDYSNKFNTGTFTAGAKITCRRNSIFHEFYTMENNSWIYSNLLSNDLLHTELVPAAYLMFASKIGKNFNYKIGLRGEFSRVTLNSVHNNLNDSNSSFFLAPSLSGIYKLSKRDEIGFAFSRRIGRPTYPQLNPYMSMVDATTYEQGNMNLKPEKSSKFDITYSHKGKGIGLFADAYVNYTSDYISQITTIQNDLLVTTYANALSDIKTGLDISFSVSVTKWLKTAINSNTYYVNTKGEYSGTEINNKGWSNNSNIQIDVAPIKSTDIQLQYFVTSPQYYPQLTAAQTHYMNIGVKQKLFKGVLSLSLLLTDVFNTYKWEVHSNNKVFNLTNLSTNKSRMLWLGITYNINSFKQKKVQSKASDDRTLIKLGL